jgi:hypothetical protein
MGSLRATSADATSSIDDEGIEPQSRAELAQPKEELSDLAQSKRKNE